LFWANYFALSPPFDLAMVAQHLVNGASDYDKRCSPTSVTQAMIRLKSICSFTYAAI